MPHPLWSEHPDGTYSRPFPPVTLKEAEHGSERIYVVQEAATRPGVWLAYVDERLLSSSSWPSAAAAMLAADQDAVETQRKVGPVMVERLGLNEANWQFDFARQGLWVRNRHRHDVTIGRREEGWKVYVGREVQATGTIPGFAAEVFERTGMRMSPRVQALRDNLASFARSDGAGPSHDDTDDWRMLLDAEGRLVLAMTHQNEASYVAATEAGYVVMRCRTVDLLDVALELPGQALGTGTHLVPREAQEAMLRENGFALPSLTGP